MTWNAVLLGLASLIFGYVGLMLAISGVTSLRFGRKRMEAANPFPEGVKFPSKIIRSWVYIAIAGFSMLGAAVLIWVSWRLGLILGLGTIVLGALYGLINKKHIELKMIRSSSTSPPR